jgi:hypothetical protein
VSAELAVFRESGLECIVWKALFRLDLFSKKADKLDSNFMVGADSDRIPRMGNPPKKV